MVFTIFLFECNGTASLTIGTRNPQEEVLSLKIRILSRILDYNFMCPDDFEYINEVTKRLNIIRVESWGPWGKHTGE